MNLTQEKLKELLEYDPETGHFRWLACPRNRIKPGVIAGCKTKCNGRYYIRIRVNLVRYLAHRLAYLYMTGELPRKEVDHIDGDGTNNRWVNLREVTHSQNGKNKKLFSNNKSGVSGVYWLTEKQKWHASIRVNGVRKFLGHFHKLEDAKEARLKAQDEYGFHKNHGK